MNVCTISIITCLLVYICFVTLNQVVVESEATVKTHIVSVVISLNSQSPRL